MSGFTTEIRHALAETSGVAIEAHAVGDDLEGGLATAQKSYGNYQVVVNTPFTRLPLNALAADGGEDWALLSEEVLEHWVTAHGQQPTEERREGFRLLGLHRLGTKGDPSFNACRETAREVAYHYNLVTMQPGHSDITNRLQLMGLVSKHLYLFIAGKLQVAGLGEFCCSSTPIRTTQDYETTTPKEA